MASDDLREDLSQLDMVAAQFEAVTQEMSGFQSSFTANVLATIFKQLSALRSQPGVPHKIFEYFADKLEEHFGKCDHTAVS